MEHQKKSLTIQVKSSISDWTTWWQSVVDKTGEQDESGEKDEDV